jgi:hypothetical protein
MLLWQEYRAQNPKAYGYSRFCELYRDWESRLSPTMRQVHPAGERLFVDYAGQTIDVIDGATGEVRAAQIFVAVLGASSYTYAEATATQTLPDWIGAHARALSFIGGVPRQIVPDNPKVGVQRHDLLEIAEERYGRGATLITSQLPVDRWHSVIGEPTLADAILDRIIHNAHRLQLKGDSLRKQTAAKALTLDVTTQG